jgi:MFS family permease
MIIPLFLEDHFHLSYYLIGLFFTASSILMLLTQIPSGYLADRYSRRKLIAACVIFPPFLIGIWPFIENWTMLIILYAASMGFWSMTWPATSALLSDSVSSELLGTAFGIRMTGVRLGFTIGPMLSGLLYTTYGHSTPFMAATLFHLIVIPLALLIKENYNEDDRSNEDG